MNVNKKFGRLRQWGRERMGGEIATTNSEEFKALQVEMDLRHQGMDRLQQSANAYIKSLSKRDQGEGKEKQLAVAHFGATMAAHGGDFEPDSEFGMCLMSLGRANERIARMQETYCANATSSWLESTERSMIQMKEYSAAKKKLEQRRLAYDTASAKMQKVKREDYKSEEELRSQKQKYEESNEDVLRRMLDIKEAEVDSVADITSFLEAELAYYDRCREVLLQLKKDWPATVSGSTRSSSPANSLVRRETRSRTNSLADRFSRVMSEDAAPEAGLRQTIGSRTVSGQNSPRRELPGFDLPATRPTISRNNSGFEGPTNIGREATVSTNAAPAPTPTRPRAPTDPSQIYAARNGLRQIERPDSRAGAAAAVNDVFGDDHQSDDSDEQQQPTSAVDSVRSGSWSMYGQDGSNYARKAPPPPPPPSRSKKPPPPPPMKRSALSTSEVPRY